MKKFINIFLAVLITLFSFPINGASVSAEGKVYDDIEDGEYEITTKLLKEGTDEKSAAADFMSNKTTLEVIDGKATLTFFIPDNPAMEFKKFELEGKKANIEPGTAVYDEKETNGMYYKFKLDELKGLLSSEVSYEVPMLNLIHDNVGMDIQLVGLNELPIVKDKEEEPTPEKPENPEEDPKDEGVDEGGENETEKPEEDSEDGSPKLDLSDGNYTFDVSYLRSDKDDTSSMGNYLGDTAFVEVKDGKAELTITVTDKDSVTKLQIDGQDPVEVVEDNDNRYERFSLNGLAETTDAYVEYQASMGDYVHEGNATFRIVFDEETKVEAEAKDKPGYGLLATPEKKELSLDNGYYTADVTYYHAKDNKSSAMARYLGNTVFFELKDGTVELTVTIDDNESVTLLQVEGEEPVEVVDDGKKNYETFKLDELTTVYNAYTEYQAAYQGGFFEGKADFRIVIDEGSVKKASKQDKPGYVKEVTLGNKVSVDGVGKLTISGDKKSQLFINDKLNNNVTVEITSKEKEELPNLGNLILAGQVYDFNFENLPDDQGNFTLELGYDSKKYPTNKYDVGIYYFDEQTEQWVFVENSQVKGDVVVANVTHFSMYGVFAVEKPVDSKNESDKDKKESEKPTKEEILTPDKVYEIEYTILHENGNDISMADEYFTGLATLIEKDGNKYVHLTITSGDMVKELKNKYGDALLVKKNKDGSIIIQLKVDNDLSDMLLSMRIIVPAGAIPGFPGYDETHDAILTFDKATKREIKDSNVKLVSSTEDNKNGPYIEDAIPGKPNLEDNGDKKDGDKKDNKTGNPKTGDTSQIFFFTMLLIGSLGVLFVQLRRRLAA